MVGLERTGTRKAGAKVEAHGNNGRSFNNELSMAMHENDYTASICVCIFGTGLKEWSWNLANTMTMSMYSLPVLGDMQSHYV